MSNLEKQGLVEKRSLTAAEIAEIGRLAQICDAHDQATMRINWDSLAVRAGDRAYDYFYYQDGMLVGELSLYAFGHGEPEASAMVHPDYRRRGIFRALAAAAVAELRRHGTPKLIFFCDHNSQSGIAALGALGAQYGYSEHKMVLDQPRVPDSFDPRLEVARAGAADVEDVARIIAASFEGDEEGARNHIARHIGSDARHFYIGRLDGTPIGALNLIIDESGSGIYGFGVLPEYRGRGYGRQILARAIEYALAEGRPPIFLEVAPENDAALGLYTSVGFRETNRYDYYNFDMLTT